jgi:hypothetical protein
MPIHEFVDEGLGHSSCLIDLDDRRASIVDRPRLPIAREQLARSICASIGRTIVAPTPRRQPTIRPLAAES